LVLAVCDQDCVPEAFVLTVMQQIKSSQLEESLLMLPFVQVVELLKNIAYWIENQWNPMLSNRLLTFLLKSHHAQLVATRTLKPILERIQTSYKSQLIRKRDEVGYNLAGLLMMKREIKENALFFGESSEPIGKSHKRLRE
jgi:U3 small nucleolar RNA-associated protein 12